MTTCRVLPGDCLDVLPTLEDASVDAVVTDPPYGLEFMGKDWDHGVPGVAFWAAIIRTLKPASYMLAFGGTRTHHRLACAIEDAGFEIRDCVMWIYGSGYPKGKGCLKPAYEPIILARKPGRKVLPLNIDACRVGTTKEVPGSVARVTGLNGYGERDGRRGQSAEDGGHNPDIGRWPANVTHDGSDEVMEAFAAHGPTSTTGRRSERSREATVEGTAWGVNNHRSDEYANEPPGTAARFFYCAKASKRERGEGNNHPCVKPLSLMQYLVRLVTPPGGTVLDPFAGSGTTLFACLREGFSCVGIESVPEYAEIARQRLAEQDAKTPLFPAAPPANEESQP